MKVSNVNQFIGSNVTSKISKRESQQALGKLVQNPIYQHKPKESSKSSRQSKKYSILHDLDHSLPKDRVGHQPGARGLKKAEILRMMKESGGLDHSHVLANNYSASNNDDDSAQNRIKSNGSDMLGDKDVNPDKKSDHIRNYANEVYDEQQQES